MVALVRATSDVRSIASSAENTVFAAIDSAPLEQIMRDHRIDTVVHLACNQGRAGEDIASLLATNVLLGIELLQAACQSGVARFLNADTLLEAGVNAYAQSKKQFTAWLPHFSQAIAIANLRLGNIYGPGEPASGFLSWLLGEFARGATAVELTPGEQLRDFVHAADVSSALLAVLDHSQTHGLDEYDVGCGELISVRTFVELARSVFAEESGRLNTRLMFGALPYRPGEVMRPRFDTSALFNLGWRPSLGPEAGLRDTVRTHLANRRGNPASD